MSWVSNFLTSSIGQKLIMSLTGLFLILFLVVHLIGNLQLLMNDGGQAFNEYAYFMTHNKFIKTISYGLYAFIVIHAIQGILIWRKNRMARSSRYAVNKANGASWASRNMGWLGVVILAFILVHMYQFWLQMKLGNTEMVSYGGNEIKDLYSLVSVAFQDVGFVIFYVASMIFIAFHLWHGFQSSFQSLGLNHKKYTPFIQGLGKVYAIVVPLGFAIIPLVFFFMNKGA